MEVYNRVSVLEKKVNELENKVHSMSFYHGIVETVEVNNLIWMQKNLPGSYSWVGIQHYIAELNAKNSSLPLENRLPLWRLPNIYELFCFIEHALESNNNYFIENCLYWTSTLGNVGQEIVTFDLISHSEKQVSNKLKNSCFAYTRLVKDKI